MYLRALLPVKGAGGSRSGLTLIEVVIAVAIFAIGITSLVSAMLYGHGAFKKNAHELTALALAREKIEELMNIKYSSLSTSPGYYDESAVVLDSASGITADIDATVESAGANKKRVTVAVNWSEMGRSFQTTLRTLSSNNNVVQ